MARRYVLPPPPESRQFRNTEEIDHGIAKLRRRIADVDVLKTDRVNSRDARVQNTEHAIRDTVREVFGQNSPEFKDHEHIDIWKGGYRIGMGAAESQAKFEAGIPDTITKIEGLIQRLKEKREEFAKPEAAPRAEFEGRSLNTAIAEAARELYRNGHYAEAVFAAGKVLIDLVKKSSGREDLDGSPLMQMVFSVKNPTLVFNDLSDQTDQDEQQGMMFLYAGAAMGIRNPLGHRVGVKERPARFSISNFCAC